jgi:hypothetical protein
MKRERHKVLYDTPVLWLTDNICAAGWIEQCATQCHKRLDYVTLLLT